MQDDSITTLLAALKHPDEAIRQQATADLWQTWFDQKGASGSQLLLQGQRLISQGQMREAEQLLSELVDHLPDFAEAWNQRAVLYFLQHRYRDSIADCEQVITLVPYHFGALHGLGLCHAALGNYRQAIQAFRQALEVQPYALINQRLILECTAHLS